MYAFPCVQTLKKSLTSLVTAELTNQCACPRISKIIKFFNKYEIKTKIEEKFKPQYSTLKTDVFTIENALRPSIFMQLWIDNAI